MTEDVDWQSNKSVTECNRYMWETQIGCDVTFITGDKKEPITAHKYVLISRSCVFYAMLAGPLQGNNDTIEIPDVEASIFKEVLFFLYTGNGIKIDLNNVLSLLYISKKYLIQSLIDKCLQQLSLNVTPTNVCIIMENAHIYGENNLQMKCRDLILCEAEVVFKSDTLVELCADCLCEVVKSDELPLDEKDIFQAVVAYSKQKCTVNGYEVNPENQTKVVEKVLKHIRYPIMEINYFMETVEPTKIIPLEDYMNIMKYYINPDVDCTGFSSKRRIMRTCVSRFAGVNSGWGYKRGKIDAITFVSSEKVLIHGVEVYGSCEGKGRFDVKLSLCVQNLSLRQDLPFTDLACKRVSIDTHSAHKVYTILFTKPVEVQKSKEYTFILCMTGHSSSYFGVNGEDKLTSGDIQFNITNCPNSTNNTNSERGQIPGIIFERLFKQTCHGRK